MALSDFLRATKRLILDDSDFPADQLHRVMAIRGEFPKLSPEEAEDLAAMPSSGLWIYRRSIIGIEKSLIRLRLPRSVRFLEEVWLDFFGKPLDLREEVLSSQRAGCWKGYETTALLISFEQYLKTAHPEIFQRYPQLADLLRYERLIYDLRRAPDLPGIAESQSGVTDCDMLRVIDGVLTVSLCGSSFVSAFRVEDLSRLSAQAQGELGYWIYRDRSFRVMTTPIGIKLGDALSQSRGRTVTVVDFLDGAFGESGEAVVREALLELLALVDLGAVQVAV